MKKKTPHLDHYYKHAGDNYLYHGLCYYTDYTLSERLLKLFKPTADEMWEHFYGRSLYWGRDEETFKFGPTRQNIVLLMAAMNGEL